MSAVISGIGLGLYNGSLGQLGRGLGGSARLGQGKDEQYVNIANGNLVLRSQDEYLSFRGLGVAALRTYNSRGQLSDSGSDAWITGFERRVELLSGSVDTAGSVMRRHTGDGSYQDFAYVSPGVYRSTVGDGSHDTLVRDSSDSSWVWTEYSASRAERYANHADATLKGRLIRIREMRSENVTAIYWNVLYDAAGRIAEVAAGEAGSAEALLYTYNSSGQLTALSTRSNGVVREQVIYRYDGSGRLYSVLTDLTPDDPAGDRDSWDANNFANNDGYWLHTVYTYADASSRQIVQVRQSDGTLVSYTYDAQGRVRTLTRGDSNADDSDGVGQTLTFTYDDANRSTEVADSTGRSWGYAYDAAGQLTEVRAPAVAGLREVTQYSYDAAGNLARVKSVRGSAVLAETVYQYDGNGNVLWQWDTVDPASGAAATAIQRTWTATNQLASQTVYTGLDPDRELAAQAPGGGLTTSYVYDAFDRLRFSVGADGAVQEFEYETAGAGAGQVAKARRYLGAAYAGAATLPALSAWATTAQRAQSALVESSYDLKGRLAGTTSYAQVDASGNGVANDAAQIVQYRYDAHGLLIQRQLLRSSTATADDARDVVQTTTYRYDGLDRLLSEVVSEKTGSGADEIKRSVAQWSYLASSATVRIVSEGGAAGDGIAGNDRVRLEVRDAAGQLIRVSESAVGGGDARTLARHYYDSAGRLRASEDAGGARRYFFYDGEGQLAGEVDATGAVVEYLRDELGRIAQTLAYATRVDTSAWLVAGAVAPTALSAIRPAANADDRSAVRSYDALGRLTSERNGDGATARYSYDGAGRLLQVALQDGAGNSRVARSFYDAAGRVAGELDAEGYLVEYSYDLAGRRIGRKAYATVTAAAQRASGTLAQLRPAADALNDQATRWFFDGRDNLVGQLDAEGYLSEYVFDEARNQRATKAYAQRLTGLSGSETLAALRASAAAGEVRETRRSYDALGRLSVERNAEGTLTRYSYDAQGNLLRAERAADTSELRESRLRYNVYGELTGELTGEGAARVQAGMSEAQLDALFAQYGVRHSYDLFGRRIESIDPAGNKTWYFYDAAGRETFVVRGVADASGVANAQGEVRETRYTAFGEVRDTTAYTGRIAIASAGSRDSAAAAIATLAYVAASDSRRSYTYTQRGQLAAFTGAEGLYQEYHYNAFGERVREAVLSTGATSTVETDYDRRGLAIVRRDGVDTALVRSTSSVYDAFGRVVRSTDARGTATSYGYDRLGRQLSSRVTVMGREQVVARAYDAFGRVLSVTDALGRATTTVYDTANRSSTTTTPEGIAVTTSYDRHGQQVKVSTPLPGGAVAETRYVYDRDGRLLSSTDPLGRSAGNEYDARGLLVASVDGSGRRVELRYDAAGRLLRRIEDPAGLALTTTYRYDGQGRKIETVDASGRVVAYAYDREGRLLEAAQDPAGLNLRTRYRYDAQGRQVRVTEGAGTAAARTVQYDYDDLGRRIAERVDPDGLNLTTAYVYDKQDNVVRRIDAHGSTIRFYYDEAGQLIYTVDPLGVMTRNWYDPAGRVVAHRTLIVATDASTLTDATSIGELDARIVWDPLDPHTFTVYDRDGRASLVMTGLGTMEEMTYDAAGRVSTVRRFAVRWPDFTQAWFDKMYAGTALPGDFNLASLRNDAADQITYNVYTAAGELRTTVDNAGSVISYVYDGAGRRVVQKHYSHAAQFNPTIRAKLTAGTASPQDVIDVTPVDNATDRVSYISYDGAGRARYAIDASGGMVETLYDAAGRIVGSRAYATAVALDATLKPQLIAGDSAAFLALGTRLAASADDARDLREYRVYDAAGRLAANVDGAGYVVVRGYDDTDNATLERRQAVAANISAALRAKLAAGTASFAELAAVAPQDENADTVIWRVHDAAGRERFALTQTGLLQAGVGYYTVQERRYDGAGRVVVALRYDSAIAFGAGVSIADIDAALNLSGSYAAGRYRQTRYAYDNNGRLRFTVDNLGAVAEQRYDGAGRVIEARQYAGFIPAGTPMTEAAIAAAAAGIGEVRKTVTTYDATDNPLTVTDALGQVRRYGYDNLGQLRSYTNANGHVWNYDYDAAGRRVAEFSPNIYVATADAAGNYSESARRIVTRTVYDALGNVLSRIEDADAGQPRTVRYEYDNRGQQVRTVFPDPGRLDANGRLIASGVQPTLETAYDAFGRVVVQKDTRGNYRYNVYDGQGRLAYEVDAEGYVTGYAYDGLGQRTQLRRHAQRLDTAAIGGWSAGQPLRQSQVQAALAAGPADRTITTRYDRRGLVVQVEQAQVSYYTAAGALATGTPTVRTSYDAYGQKTKESTLLEGVAGQPGARWADAYTYYDRLGRATTTVDAEGYVTQLSYNAVGEVVQSIEYAKPLWAGELGSAAPPAPPPAGDLTSGYDRVMRWGYDALGRKTSEIASRRFQRSDGTGGLRDVATTYGYDGEDRLVRVQNEAGTTTTGYDALGRIRNVTEPTRRVVNDLTLGALYDAQGRDLNTSWIYENSAPYTEMIYDAFGNLVRTYKYARGALETGLVISPKDQFEWVRYDYQGRAIATIAANGDTVYTEYDAADNVLHRWHTLLGNTADRNARVDTWYEYDKSGRAVHVSQTRQGLSSAWTVADLNQWTGYNAFGEITSRSHVGIQGTLVNGYDAAGRLISSNETGGLRSFGYNLAGQQVREQRSAAIGSGQRVDAVTWHTLDRLGRVVSTRQPSNTDDPAATSLVQQRRDRWGNVLETVDARGYRTNYRYNELNQLTRDERPLVEAVSETGASSWTRPVNEWYYDALGRLIGTRDANGNTRLNRYDNAGQLVESRDAFGQATLYAYDALGQQRLVQSPTGRLTYQSYDSRGRLVESGDYVVNDQVNRTQVRLQSYLLNQNGDRVQVIDALGNVTRYDYTSTGQVARMQSATGQVTHYAYDVQGRKTGESYGVAGARIQDRDGESVGLDELSWDYDVYGRLIDHNNLSGRDSDYQYLADTGQLATEHYSGGPVGDAVRIYSYYPNGRIKAIYENGPDPTYRYEYDAAGNRTLEEVFTREGNMVAWTRTITRSWYDSNNRVQRVVQDDLSGGGAKRILDLRYSYDAAGNRRRVSAGASYGSGSDVQGVPSSNSAPIAIQAPPARSVPKGVSSEFSIVFSEVFRDAEQDPLTLQVSLADGSALPAWLTATRDGSSGRIVFVAAPGADVPDQDLTIRLLATETGNPANATATTFALYVRSNRAPLLLDAQPTPLRLKAGGDWAAPLALGDYFVDTDIGDELRMSVDNAASLPSWVQFDPATMRLRALASAPGQTFALLLRATDRAGQSVVKILHLSVGDNTAPTGPSPLPSQAIVTHQDFLWSSPLGSVFNDADGDSLQVTASGLPSWLSFQRTTTANRPELRLVGRVPPNVAPGTVYTVTFTANDGFGGSKSTTLTLTVRGGNRAPDAPTSFPMPRATVGLWYSQPLPAFTDADGDTLTYRISALPPGLSLDPNTRVVSGVVSAPGNVTATYTATDTFGASRSVEITFFVLVNTAPTPSSIPNQSAGVGSHFAYQIPLFGDPDGDTVSYGANGLPPGMSISSGGVISGTPSTGGNYTVTVIGTDARGASASTSFVIVVNAAPPPNNAPVRNYTPTNWSMEISEASVGYEDVYWPPNAFVDPDGNPLTYQLINSPNWVVYNPSQGPTSNHHFGLAPPGQTRNYTITVRATDSFGAYVDMSFNLMVVYRKGGGVANAAPAQAQSFDMGPGEAVDGPQDGMSAPESGNVAATAAASTAPVQYRDSWFTYDAENRIAINNGRLIGGVIALTAEGGDSYRLDYDAAGNVSARTFYRGNTLRVQFNSYDLRGNLIAEHHETNASNGGFQGISRNFAYDANNRLTQIRSYYPNGSTWTRTSGSGQSHEEWETYDYSGWLRTVENYSYDAAGRVLYQDKIGRNEAAPNWIQLASQNNQDNRQSYDVSVLNTLNNRIEYRDANGNSTYDAFGRATGFKTTTLTYTHTFAIAYEGWESYQQKAVTGTSSNPDYRPTTNTLSYDALGRLIVQQETTRLSSGAIDDRIRYYAYNGEGQVQQRREGVIKNGQFVQEGELKQNYLYAYAGGQQMAQISDGSRIVSLNGVGMYEAGGAKVVAMAGETLRSLAQRIYGNDLLWYVLAEANGLGNPDQEIGSGRELNAPRVDVSRNDAGTFKPYDPGEAIGSTVPSLPLIPPPQNAHCSAFATILRVIAIAAAVILPPIAPVAAMAIGALGETAAQTVEIREGLRSGYDAGAIVATGFSGYTGGFSPTGGVVLDGAIQAATNYLGSYAVNKAIGSEDHFSWRGLAVDVVTAGATAAIAPKWGTAAGALAQGSFFKAAGLAITNSVVKAAAGKLIMNTPFNWRDVANSAVANLSINGLIAGAYRGGLWDNVSEGPTTPPAASDEFQTYPLADNGTVSVSPYAEWIGPPSDSNEDGIHGPGDNSITDNAIMATAKGLGIVYGVARAYLERDPNAISVAPSDRIKTLDTVTITGPDLSVEQNTPPSSLEHRSSVKQIVAVAIRQSIEDNIKWGKISAGVVVGVPTAIAKGVYGTYEMSNTFSGQSMYMLSGGHFQQTEHEKFIRFQTGVKKLAQDPVETISAAINTWRHEAISEYNKGNYFTYGMKAADASTALVTAAEGGYGLAKFGINSGKTIIRANIESEWRAFNGPTIGSKQSQIGAIGSDVNIRSTNPTQAPSKSRMAELQEKWGNLSAIERRAQLEARVEANAEKWVKKLQDDLSQQHPELNPHFWDKHAPDILLPGLEQRSIDGSHPRFGTPGRKNDSSQFADFKTMMDVLNEATTRQTRNLSRYNASNNRPWVNGTLTRTAGHGYLKVPNGSPPGTRPVFVPSYINWTVRFDQTTHTPYTAFPTR